MGGHILLKRILCFLALLKIEANTHVFFFFLLQGSLSLCEGFLPLPNCIIFYCRLGDPSLRFTSKSSTTLKFWSSNVRINVWSNSWLCLCSLCTSWFALIRLPESIGSAIGITGFGKLHRFLNSLWLFLNLDIPTQSPCCPHRRYLNRVLLLADWAIAGMRAVLRQAVRRTPSESVRRGLTLFQTAEIFSPYSPII